MLKLLMTIAKGNLQAVEEDVTERHALQVLDGSIREAANALESCGRGLAAAMAQSRVEERRLAEVEALATDLEHRAVAALAGGRADLAAEAATDIALLEAERDVIAQSRAAVATRVTNLRAVIADGRRRLADLQHGRRLAAVTEALDRRGPGRLLPATTPDKALRQAEDALRRLRDRHVDGDADTILHDLARSGTIAERLAAEGFGPPARPAGAAVLERLKLKAAGAPQPMRLRVTTTRSKEESR